MPPPPTSPPSTTFPPQKGHNIHEKVHDIVTLLPPTSGTTKKKGWNDIDIIWAPGNSLSSGKHEIAYV